MLQICNYSSYNFVFLEILFFQCKPEMTTNETENNVSGLEQLLIDLEMAKDLRKKLYKTK